MSEINFDGLVGPTHNYAGLSFGNVASVANAGNISNPRLAAKQGLQKMRLLMEMGIPQAVLPPQQRPNFDLLRTLGFSGQSEQMLQQAFKANPRLLYAVYSAASMWTANMATVSPSCNTGDHKVHITPANLTFNLHRAQEAVFSYKLLQKIFNDAKYFVVHAPLPGFRDLSDEGAANHSVISTDYNVPGLELFVYGRQGLDEATSTLKYPARQTKLSSLAITQQHKLSSDNILLIQQANEAIDAGVFHNDVIFVANKNVIFYHELGFSSGNELAAKIKYFLNDNCYLLVVSKDQLSLKEAVSTYLFNSQIVSTDMNSMALIAPIECKESQAAMNVIDSIIAAHNPIKEVKFVECRQSMHNGGGPACLRLRVQLNKEEQAASLQSLYLTPELYQQLDSWVEKFYRDRLVPDDLLDPKLVIEVQTALEQLTQILQLGPIYPFQQL